MKFFISMLLTALLGFTFCLYLDWWAIAIAAFAVAVCIHQRPAAAFLTGFLALLLLWGGLSWWIDMRNEHLLARQLSKVLPFGGSVALMIMVTAIIGALVAGFASMAGSYLRAKK